MALDYISQQLCMSVKVGTHHIMEQKENDMIHIVAAVGWLGVLGVSWAAVRILRNATALEENADQQVAKFHQLWVKEREKHISLVEHLRSLVLVGEQDNDVL